MKYEVLLQHAASLTLYNSTREDPVQKDHLAQLLKITLHSYLLMINSAAVLQNNLFCTYSHKGHLTGSDKT